MHSAILLLGGNLGNTLELFALAQELISSNIGQITKQSSLWKSEPWGFTHQNIFYNQVIVCTPLNNAETTLEQCLAIEKQLGRERISDNRGYQARTIDIDILFFDNLIINSPTLTLPHPLLHKRRFTLAPLSEILPQFIHPVYKKSSIELLDICDDTCCVERMR